MAETKVTEEHAEVEGFLSAFGEGVVLSLLCAQTNRGAEFDLPADTRTVQKKYVGACGATKIQVSAPVAVSASVESRTGIIGPLDRR